MRRLFLVAVLAMVLAFPWETTKGQSDQDYYPIAFLQHQTVEGGGDNQFWSIFSNIGPSVKKFRLTVTLRQGGVDLETYASDLLVIIPPGQAKEIVVDFIAPNLGGEYEVRGTLKTLTGVVEKTQDRPMTVFN